MSCTTLKFNHLPRIQSKMPKVALESVILAADELCDALAKALDDGNAGIQSDTGALAKSLYVKATGRDDYAAALAAARAAYTSNPSRYRGAGSGDSTLQGFDRIVAEAEPLQGTEAHVYVAAVATMLAYGNKLEFEREWMQPGALAWAQIRLAQIHTQHLQRAFK